MSRHENVGRKEMKTVSSSRSSIFVEEVEDPDMAKKVVRINTKVVAHNANSCITTDMF